MSSRISISLLILISTLLILSTTACSSRMIQGRVVDAETGKPLEKAAIYIYWSKRGPGPPGLAGYVDVEVSEDLTDDKGLFKVPKYSTLFKNYTMAIYKKGYVCWSSNKIFPSYVRRKNFRLKNGMVIRLEPIKEEYSKEKHASFTLDSSVNRKSPGLFEAAIKSEMELERKMLRRNRRK